MNTSSKILTRKVQLFIDSTGEVVIGKTYKTLYQWQYICFRAANYIFTHYFIQEQIKDLFYLTDDVIVKLSDIHKDEDGILTSSKLNTTYRVLTKHFKGDIPMHILGSLNMTLSKYFNSEKLAYLKGEKSVRNFKRSIPIPFMARDFRNLHKIEQRQEFGFTLFSLPFRTYLGADRYDKRVLFDKLLSGEMQLRTSSLQLDKNKIFLLATYDAQSESHDLDTAVVAEASLSIDFPIVVKIGKSRFTIGSKEEFLYRRLAIQSARQRVQKMVSSNKGQHGRQRKLKPLEPFREKERNYVQQKLHTYSRQLIDLCVKHNAASLILVGQTDKEAAVNGDEFILRNWSYYTLKEKIEYKANQAGIMLIAE